MYHLSGPKDGHEVVPAHHFEALYEQRRPPQSVEILVGYNDAGPVDRVQQFEHFGIQLFLPPLIGQDGIGVGRSGYAITVSIGKLAFQVIGVDAADFLIPELFLDKVAWEPYIVRLWPSIDREVWWPPPRSLGHGQVEVFATRLGRPKGGWESTPWARLDSG